MLPCHESQERKELGRKMSCSVECQICLKRYVNIEEPVRISVSLGKELTSLLFRTRYKINGTLILSVKKVSKNTRKDTDT